MKRITILLVLTGILVLFLIATGSAAFVTSSSASQYQASSGCDWIPGYGTYCRSSESYSEQTSSTYSNGMQMAGMPIQRFPMTGWGGNYFTETRSSWNYDAWTFMANGTQMQDVTGIWATDLLGNMSLKLTGDDIIRGSYVDKDNQGYVQGNFTATNESPPMMDGLWWEKPTYQPPYSAGVMQITFINDTALTGIFSYADGIWGPFNGTKISGNLSAETEAQLIDMPEVNWTLNYDEQKNLIVSNPLEDNPVMKVGNETTI